MKKLKSVLALILSAALLLSMAACGATNQPEDTQPKATDPPVEGPPAYVTEPVTITIWHNRGAGANLDALRRSIDAFNATNEYGIIVEEEYIGGYATVLSKTATAVAAGNNPTMVLLHSAGIVSLASKGAFADMTPYAERDQFDISNFIESLMAFSYYDGKLISFPYVASTCMLAYNKDMLSAVGYDAPPRTIAELEDCSKKIRAATGKFGFGMYISADYIVDPLLRDLGGVGIMGNDNTTACLDNGTMKKVMDDWRSWITAGWCAEPNVTSGATLMIQDVQNGNVAMTAYSSGGMSDVMAYAKEAGQNVDFGYLPGYSGPATNIGGGNLAILGANQSQQEIAAAWEFMKFIYQDEWVVDNSISTGYLPVTHSSTQNAELQAFWEENPWFKRAYEQLEWAKGSAFSEYEEEWRNAVNNALSYVIQDGTMTSDEAIGYLKRQASVIFYE